MRQPIRRRVGLPAPVLVDRQPVVRPRPHAIAIHQHRVHMVIRQPIRRREVLEPEPRHRGHTLPLRQRMNLRAPAACWSGPLAPSPQPSATLLTIAALLIASSDTPLSRSAHPWSDRSSARADRAGYRPSISPPATEPTRRADKAPSAPDSSAAEYPARRCYPSPSPSPHRTISGSSPSARCDKSHIGCSRESAAPACPTAR